MRRARLLADSDLLPLDESAGGDKTIYIRLPSSPFLPVCLFHDPLCPLSLHSLWLFFKNVYFTMFGTHDQSLYLDRIAVRSKQQLLTDIL